ncbi:MAG: hypothetical protein K0R44_3772 [Thermomicrobiales bacterium]|jgi:hypothetical protein|nr:hypothetical protein [Thermomicrobiales bacterium]
MAIYWMRKTRYLRLSEAARPVAGCPVIAIYAPPQSFHHREAGGDRYLRRRASR